MSVREKDETVTKKSFVMTLVTHVGHEEDKEYFEVREVCEKVDKSVSKKQIKRALDGLEEMGLINHNKNEQKYYFKPNQD